jgi:hypothetical protein
MRNNKCLGSLLIALALLVLLGMFVEFGKWWLVVDILVIIVCGAGGAKLLNTKI